MPDVIVIGSGAGGLAAALGAAHNGADVLVLEAAATFGGSTAISAGAAWLPANHAMAAADLADDAEQAIAYMGRLACGDVDMALLEAYARDSARVGERLTEISPLRWQVQMHPDYHLEEAGAHAGGRTLEPAPLVLEDQRSREVAACVRVGEPGDLGTEPVTFGQVLRGATNAATDAAKAGVLTMGRGLVAALAIGASRAGVDLRTSVRARGLRIQDGRVRGVETDDGPFDGRVVLASGGFERSPELVRTFLRGPHVVPLGVPGLVGDGLRMALTAGAALGNMSEAWWCPAYRIPGESVEGEPRYRILFPAHRAHPGSLMVDRRGERFADEAQNYNDLGRTLHEFATGRFEFARIPAWLIFDDAYRRGIGVGLLGPPGQVPSWCVCEQGLGELASRIGVGPARLCATVERFNAAAAAGSDPEHCRGRWAYDRFHGVDGVTLGPLREPPFGAVEVLPGAIGTKGGPRTDDCGRVQRPDNSGSIPGLYAVGNCAASPLGYLYPGAGGTIGPALVFGMRAGEAAASVGGGGDSRI